MEKSVAFGMYDPEIPEVLRNREEKSSDSFFAQDMTGKN